MVGVQHKCVEKLTGLGADPGLDKRVNADSTFPENPESSKLSSLKTHKISGQKGETWPLGRPMWPVPMWPCFQAGLCLHGQLALWGCLAGRSILCSLQRALELVGHRESTKTEAPPLVWV